MSFFFIWTDLYPGVNLCQYVSILHKTSVSKLLKDKMYNIQMVLTLF